MKANYVKMLSVLAIMLLAATAAGTSAVAQGNEREDEGRTLEGTWVVQVTVENCQTHAILGNPFLSLLTFARGGTMTETTANPQFFPAERGPGHGVWIHTGPHTYKAASTAFITLNGVLVRTQTITQTIDVKKPDAFVTTVASVQFFKPDGTLLLTGCATAVGTRFEVEE